jgi:hypothetical protein
MEYLCVYADPEPDLDPAQNLDLDPDPDPEPGGGEGVGQPKMCIPPGKILGTPLTTGHVFRTRFRTDLNLFWI